jgi:exopolyphosphatase/guanosine-5'-triphosphate,3'-diphosphate pyrophosphatase
VRAACIDIGTNTTRLLVAERAGRGLRAIAAERRFTALGTGRAPGDPMGAERIDAIAGVVEAQARLARELRAERIVAVATAAIRDAPDRDVLLDAVRDTCGVEVRVLDGREEARLAFLGAVQTLAREPEGVVAVVDVGGGSSEIAVGTAAGGATWSHSVPVGSGVLADAHLVDDPPPAEQLAALRDAVAEAFARVPDAPAATAAYAVGGSASSLRRLAGPRLDAAALGRALAVLCEGHSTEIARRMDLDARRVRLLPAGLLVLAAASAHLSNPLELALGGLREGVVIELSMDIHRDS